MHLKTHARRSLCAFITVCASQAVAQVSVAPPPPYGTIEGVAVDSLHNDVLRGALVSVRGTNAAGITDNSGRFHIDSVPPGKWEIDVQHPILDTIGIALRTPPLEVTAGSRPQVNVATPSAPTVIAVRCTPAERRIGPAALLGIVQNADTETPADGSRVILEYTEYRVEANKLTMVPFRREAIVPANGRFKICGLPGDLTGSITAIRGRDSTASIGVRIASLVGTAGLDLPEGSASPAKRTAKLSGLVLDPSGVPLLRARVSILGDSAVVLTDGAGRFSMQNLSSGTRMLTVRRLGFEPAQMPVVLRAQEPLDVEVRMARPALQLDTVRVIARRDAALERVGFEDRRRKGVGYFLGPQEIARGSQYDLPTLLASAPMLRRVNDNGKTVLTGRGYGTGGCVNYFVDGNIWLGGGIEDFIMPADVAAVEVYSNVNTPSQFTYGMSSCETVVVWTKARIR